MPTTVWLKINALKIQFLKITLSGSLTLLDFLIPLLVSSIQASSPGMSWGYFSDKPSPIRCTEPGFILFSLHILGFCAWLQGWQGNLLEIKCNRAIWHFPFASLAAKIINRTAFRYDRRDFKYHLAGLCATGSLDNSPTPCFWEMKQISNWLDYCKMMAPLPKSSYHPSTSCVGVLQEKNSKCLRSKQTYF